MKSLRRQLGLLERAHSYRLLFFATLGSSFGTLFALLALAVDVKDRTTGRLKYSGKLEVDGNEADYLLEGPFESSGTTRVK